MIFSKKRKYIFISTPKTGTHSMFKLLQEEFDGERITPGFHRTELPPQVKDPHDYTVFSTVRNPYDRLIALWNSLLHAKNDKKGYRDVWLAKLKRDDLYTFTKFVAKKKNDIEHIADLRLPQLVIPQYKWYQKMPSNVTPLHLENIEEEFNALPFVDKHVSIPHALHRDHASWDEVKTNEIIELANEWAGNDFELFGYKKEEPNN